MKKLLFILIIIGMSGIGIGQTPNWLWGEAETTGSCYMQGTGIFVGASDSIYIDGRFGGTMTLGGVAATASGTEVFSGKMGPNGGFKWVKPHPYSGGNDYCYGFGGDKQENTYATGLTQGSNGFFIDKYNKYGKFLWNWTLPSGIGGYGNVGVDKVGNVYVTGGFGGTQNFIINTLTATGSNDMFLAKYNSIGTCKWALHAGASAQTIGGRGVAVDPYGYIYVCGCYTGTASFYNTSNTIVKTLTATATNDFFIAKYDSTGTLLWVTTATNSGFAPPPPNYWSFNAITVDSCSNTYVTGHFTGTAAFGTLPTITSAGSADIYIAKCHSNGVWEWVQKAGGSSDDEGEGIALDKHSDVYVTGYFVGTAMFGTTSVTTSAGSAVFVAKYANSTGAFQWVQAPTGTASTGGNGISIDSHGFVYITGSISTTGTATFGPNTINGVTACGQNVLIAKLDTVPLRSITPHPDTIYCAGSTVTLPYSITGTFNAGNIFTAQLSDITGSFSTPVNIGNTTSTTSGTITITIPGGTTPGTTYLIRIISSNPATSSWANGCGAYFASNVYVANFYITIVAPPTATTSGNPTICKGDSAVISAGGGVKYTWNTGATTSGITVKPATNTTYSVSVSNGVCSKDTTVIVTVNPLPTVSFTGSNSICKGDTTVITANGGTSYTWNTGATTSSITVKPSSNTTYSVSVSNGTCKKDTSFSVVVNPLPTVTFTGNTAICKGDSTTITASGGTSYIWNTGATTSAITVKPATNTTYSVSVNNGTCKKDSSFSVTVNPLPTVTLSGSSIICKGDSTIITASGGTTYSWNTGSTSSNITVKPTSTTTYSVSVSNGTCSKDTTVTVTVNPLPSVTFTGKNSICKGDSTTITAIGGTSYTWNTGATTSSIVAKPSANTTYSVSVSNGACKKDTTFSLTINPLPAVTFSGTTTVCAGTSTTLTASGGSSYTWNTGATTSSIIVTPASNTTYSVSVSNGLCTADTSISVTVNPLPTVTFSGTTTICSGNSTTITASGGSSYIWNTGATTSSVTVNPASTTTYSVHVNNGTCTKDTAITVTVNSLPNITLAGNTGICSGDTATITASGGTSYLWNTGATTASVTFTPATTTTYTVHVNNGCAKDTTVTIIVSPKPSPTITPNQTICAGSSVNIIAGGGTTYSWNSGQTAATITVTPAVTTTYVVTASNGGCNALDSTKVIVNPMPTATAGGSTTITSGQTTPLSVTTGTGYTYKWVPSTGLSCDTCPNLVASPTVTTWYYVTVTDSAGCRIKDSVLIIVKEKCGPIYLPTAFSPNGDGWNDVLNVMGNCIKEMDLVIYDRWGNKMFETTDPSLGWDGTYKGQPMNTGTYVFLLNATDIDGNVTTKKGNITLVR